ncbi:hypothetical protein [Metapseudomonas furukawaii]
MEPTELLVMAVGMVLTAFGIAALIGYRVAVRLDKREEQKHSA